MIINHLYKITDDITQIIMLDVSSIAGIIFLKFIHNNDLTKTPLKYKN